MWKFKPIFKTKIWGGDYLLPFKNITHNLSKVGESWEISGVPGSESKVDGGPDDGMTISELIDKYESDLLGERNYEKYGKNFPLLVKFLDVRDDLSVQVHPNDDMARRHGMPNGKSEMWYIIKSTDNARIANGFCRKVIPEEFDRLVASSDIEDALRYVNVRPGDVFYIPAGRVHAACAGVLIAEIQQTSDATYRIYDYNRKDEEGKERELHTGLAREAINFHDTEGHPIHYKPTVNVPVNVVNTPHFGTNVLHIESQIMRDYSESDTFVILILTEGKASVACGKEQMEARAGDTILVPASALGVAIVPDHECTLLETYIK